MMWTFLFTVVALAAIGCTATVSNCTVDEALCTGNGVMMVMVNNVRMCCPPSATISLNNNVCTCTETQPSEYDCLTTIPLCRQTSSISTDSRGNMRCCMAGHSLSSVAFTDANGILNEKCKCRPLGGGGFLSTFMGSGGGMVMSSVPGFWGAGMAGQEGQNATAVREEWRRAGDAWRQWGQQFSQGFQQWGRNFGQSMRNMGLDLANNLMGVARTSLQNAMVPVQRAVSGMVGNVFSSIPGF